MELEEKSIDIDEFTLAMKPLFNHVILKLHRVRFRQGTLELPETEGSASGFFEVVAVGDGTVEGEPCPVEVGAWVMPQPGAARQMTPDYYTVPWVALLSEIDKEKIEYDIAKATSKLHLPKGSLTVIN